MVGGGVERGVMTMRERGEKGSGGGDGGSVNHEAFLQLASLCDA